MARLIHILLFQYCLESCNVSTLACSKHKKIVTKTSPFIIPFSFESLWSFVKAIIFKIFSVIKNHLMVFYDTNNWGTTGREITVNDYFVHTSNKNVDNINYSLHKCSCCKHIWNCLYCHLSLLAPRVRQLEEIYPGHSNQHWNLFSSTQVFSLAGFGCKRGNEINFEYDIGYQLTVFPMLNSSYCRTAFLNSRLFASFAFH